MLLYTGGKSTKQTNNDGENEGEYWVHSGDDKTKTKDEQVEKRGDIVLESDMNEDYIWKKM